MRSLDRVRQNGLPFWTAAGGPQGERNARVNPDRATSLSCYIGYRLIHVFLAVKNGQHFRKYKIITSGRARSAIIEEYVEQQHCHDVKAFRIMIFRTVTQI
ncbi:hypothetical protein [Dickeya oryzae]|uniref:hypothetical protein n=1 Tax=Dickeya oryzae TaxID=1240404 RepID=UPI001AEC931A|nr:hypothetical protein [Dickeya oryzae]MBP2849734.1 hypothetical protein [Dickeya oryzae]